MNISNRQLFLQYVAQTSDFPLMLEIEKAEGIYLYDNKGKRYTDLISGIAVSNVGHRHPHVINAIHDQTEKYLHLMVYGEYIQSPQVKLAEKITCLLPEALNNVYFTNSGAEAIEGALKLAKRHTGRREIISCYNSYHGSTHGALSLMSEERFKQPFSPLLPRIRHIRFGNIDDLDLINRQTACVVIEPVQGEAGIRTASVSYFKKLAETCKNTETLLILDEIQTGFGRTGKFFAFEDFEIVPDILVCAKGMGGGMPIGAFISSKEIMGSFKNNPVLGHITTFGGHPVCCAASLATIEVIEKEKLLSEVAEKEALFRKFLVSPAIKEIRSKGLMMAVEFDSYDTLKKIIDRSIENGVITDWFLHCNNSMRIAPPLTITLSQIEESCEVILRTIKGL